MFKRSACLACLSLLPASAATQTAILRAEVTNPPGQFSRFAVDGARSIELVSTRLDLWSIFEAGHFDLTVRRVPGSGTPIVLEVLRARRSIPNFEIDTGPRIGADATFAVRGPAGASAFVYVAPSTQVSFLPLPRIGSWLLADGVFVGQGSIGPGGEGTVRVPTPNDPRLIGLRISGQAAIVDGASVVLSNPDARTITS